MGGQRCRLVPFHPRDRVRVFGAGAGEVLLDGHRPLGERPQPAGVEPGHLPAAVAVRAPLHPEPLREPAAQVLLIDRARRLAPFVEGGGVERGEGPVGAHPQVGHHCVRVKLGICFATCSVDEGRCRQACGDPLAFAVDLLAGGARPALQESEGDGDGFHVGDRRHRGHLGAGERPQQRNALGRGERHVERRHLPFPMTAQQLGVGSRVAAQQQRPQLVGVDYPRQAELVGQVALPHAGGFPDAQVVVVDAQGDLADQILGVGQLRDPQHPAPPDHNGAGPGNARPEGWQMSVER
jgi:hypothetical protein